MDRQFWACVKGDVHAHPRPEARHWSPCNGHKPAGETLQQTRRLFCKRELVRRVSLQRGSVRVSAWFPWETTYIHALYHSAGQYAQKLFLKEEPPSPRSDITQTGLDPSKKAVFETVINGAAANAIGLKLAPALLKNADLIID